MAQVLVNIAGGWVRASSAQKKKIIGVDADEVILKKSENIELLHKYAQKLAILNFEYDLNEGLKIPEQTMLYSARF